MSKITQSDGAKRIEQFRERKHAEGLFELRGCWLPKPLHERVHLYAMRLIKNEVNK